MAEKTTPHFANDVGVPIVHIGAKEFMCIGAKPPFDHPHEFLDMGAEDEIICPYCSTLFRYRASLTTQQSDPPECLWTGGALDIASAHTGPSR